MKTLRIVLGVVLVFVGIGGFVGGVPLVLDPTGASLGMDVAALEGGPFADYLIPGVFLLLVNGLASLAAGIATFADWRWAPHTAAILGGALVAWLVVQLGIVGYAAIIQPIFLAVGVVELMLALALLRARETEPHPYRGVRWLAGGLCLLTGLTAIFGGIELIGWPRGAPWTDLTVWMLEDTPFLSFATPGVLLLVFVGLTNLIGGIYALRGARIGPPLAWLAGTVLAVWIVVEMAMLHTHDWIELVYLGIGVVTMAAAWWLWLGVRAGEPTREAT